MAYLGALLWAVAVTSLLVVALVLGAARSQRKSIEGQRRRASRNGTLPETTSPVINAADLFRAHRLAKMARDNQGKGDA